MAVQNGSLDLLKCMDSHITDQSSVYSTPNKVTLSLCTSTQFLLFSLVSQYCTMYVVLAILRY